MRVLVLADSTPPPAPRRLAAETPGPVRAHGPRERAASTPTTWSWSSAAPTCCAKGADATIVACGVEVEQALKAAELLAAEGIEAEVIDAFSVKPLDEETILASVGKTGCAVVAEEHSVMGGLGSAVAETLARTRPAPAEFVGMRDAFGKSGEFDELMAYFNLDARAIVEAVKKVMARKQV